MQACVHLRWFFSRSFAFVSINLWCHFQIKLQTNFFAWGFGTTQVIWMQLQTRATASLETPSLGKMFCSFFHSVLRFKIGSLPCSPLGGKVRGGRIRPLALYFLSTLMVWYIRVPFSLGCLLRVGPEVWLCSPDPLQGRPTFWRLWVTH